MTNWSFKSDTVDFFDGNPLFVETRQKAHGLSSHFKVSALSAPYLFILLQSISQKQKLQT